MDDTNTFDQLVASFASKIQFNEFTFPSSLPVFGPIVSGVRRVWNNISTRWYVLHYATQQQAAQQTLIELLQTIQRQQLQLSDQIGLLQADLAKLHLRQSTSDQLFNQDIELLAKTLVRKEGTKMNELNSATEGNSQDSAAVERLMQTLRNKVRERETDDVTDLPDRMQLPTTGVYRVIEQMRASINVHVPISVMGDGALPVIGSLLKRLRHALHELPVYYVNALAQRQIKFNRSTTESVQQLVIALESAEARIQALTAEVARLNESNRS